MNDYKCCSECGLEKPLTDFYTRSGMPHLYLSACKACYAERAKRQVKGDKKISTVETEQAVTERLWELGIPTLPGKALSHSYADLVAWSCVFLEVKSSKMMNGQFTFGFTPEQREKGLRGHLIVLVCDWDEEYTFHVFNASDPKFYDSIAKKLKWAVTYTPNPSNAGRKPVFTDELMAEAKDNWALIEEHKQRIVDAIRNGGNLLDSAVSYRRKGSA